MGSLSGGSGSFWGMSPFDLPQWGSGNGRKPKRRNRGDSVRRATDSNSVSSSSGAGGYHFPVKQAITAGSLALAGDTIAQLRGRWVKNQTTVADSPSVMDTVGVFLSEHDLLRAIRMASYGFLLYGPGTFAWYQYLDRHMPKQTVQNLLTKVLLNQIVLGPAVIAVIFAWNNLWLGKLAELPNKYQKDALPTLFFGFRFWIPVSVLNFWVIPLQARVAFMSMASIFWNFFLSSTMSK